MGDKVNLDELWHALNRDQRVVRTELDRIRHERNEIVPNTVLDHLDDLRLQAVLDAHESRLQEEVSQGVLSSLIQEAVGLPGVDDLKTSRKALWSHLFGDPPVRAGGVAEEIVAASYRDLVWPAWWVQSQFEIATDDTIIWDSKVEGSLRIGPEVSATTISFLRDTKIDSLEIRDSAALESLVISGNTSIGKLSICGVTSIKEFCVWDSAAIEEIEVGHTVNQEGLAVRIDRFRIEGSAEIGRLVIVGGLFGIQHQPALPHVIVGRLETGRGCSIGTLDVTSCKVSSVQLQAAIGDTLTLASGGTEARFDELAPSIRADALLHCSVGGKVVLSDVNLLSLRGCRLTETLTLRTNISLTDCDFGDFEDVEKLRFESSFLFGDGRGRKRVGHSLRTQVRSQMKIHPAELAAVYRRLRMKLESDGDRAGASDFYYHEMVARMSAASRTPGVRPRVEAALLAAYVTLSRFGTRALWPCLWFLVVSVLGTMQFMRGGFTPPGDDAVELAGVFNKDVWLYTVQSMVSFFRPPSGDHLSTSEAWFQLFLRFIGPVFVAQAVLAIRERVAR